MKKSSLIFIISFFCLTSIAQITNWKAKRIIVREEQNQPNFPSTLLKPGEVYQSTCIYTFLVKK